MWKDSRLWLPQAKGGVHGRVDHGDIQPEALGQRRPVVHSRAAQWVHPLPEASRPNRIDIDRVGQVGHIVDRELRQHPGLVERVEDLLSHQALAGLVGMANV